MSEPIETKPAFIIGWEAGASAVTDILLDLIAGLRAISYETDNPWTVAYSAVDRAEARLKEATNE